MHELVSDRPVDPKDRRRWLLILLVLLFGAMAIRMVAWVALPNYHHADEIFQYREQAFRLVTDYGVVPWEYQEGIRSWVIPGALSVPMFVSQWLTGDTVYADWAIAFGLVLLSLIPVYAGWVYGAKAGGLGGAVVASLWMLGWYELVYFSSHTLTSPVAGHLILGGAMLWGIGLGPVGRRRLVAGGVLLGLAAVIRFHLLPGIGVLTLAAIWMQGRQAIKWVAGGLLGFVLAIGLIDLLSYDYPYQWMVRNVKRNVVDDVASSFGTDPWYGYLKILAVNWRYLCLPLLVFSVAGFRRLPVLGFVGIVIVAAFSMIGHKEYRFIYPSIMIALLLSGVGLAGWVPALLRRIPDAIAWRCGGVAVLLLILAVIGYERASAWPYDRFWFKCQESQYAFRALHHDKDLECLLVHEYPWYQLPGYSVLRRDVPIAISEEGRTLQSYYGQYTHLISGVRLEEGPNGLELIDSWPVFSEQGKHLFLYRSTQSFDEPPDQDINDLLRIAK